MLPSVRDGFAELSLHGKWESLKQVQAVATYPTPSQKFRDSQSLKDLCRQRRECHDAARRLELTRLVLARRRAEKLAWLQELEKAAADGHAQSIRYLRNRTRQHSDMSGLVRAKGGDVDAAARCVKEHFRELFSPQIPAEQEVSVESIFRDLQLATGEFAIKYFSEEEIAAGLSKGKMGKSTGLSGISYELLVAMWSMPDGRLILREFLNSLLESSNHPTEIHCSFVTLVPKLAEVVTPAQIRPINLVEASTKLFCTLLVRRLVGCWPVAPCQFGGLPGGQVADALASAHWQTYCESIADKSRVWVNADIQAAFDSIHHASVARFVCDHTNPELAREALQLLRVICRPSLRFVYQGEEWHIDQTRGIQQGHTFSSILFSYLIGHVVQEQFTQWESEGESSFFGQWGWLFVDDLILHFDDWTVAKRLLPRIQQALHAIGLQFNPAKTQVFARPEMLARGRREVPDDHVLHQYTWTSETAYLRKPLRHTSVGETSWDLWLPFVQRSVHHGVVQMAPVLKGLTWAQPALALHLLNRYVGSKWLWATPVLVPTASGIKKVNTLQATALQSFMHLFIPEDAGRDQAMVLHRLRKRGTLLYLQRHSGFSWTMQWRMRLWGYLGHVLRRPPQHPARKLRFPP